MRMLPGLIKQLVLSKPIYGRMELQGQNSIYVVADLIRCYLGRASKKRMFYGHAEKYADHTSKMILFASMSVLFPLFQTRKSMKPREILLKYLSSVRRVSLNWPILVPNWRRWWAYSKAVSQQACERGSRFNWAWKWKWSHSHFHSMP